MNNISIYAGHNASVSFIDSDNNYRVIELERLYKERYFMLFNKSNDDYVKIIQDCLNIAKNEWGIENDFDVCAYGYNGDQHINLVKDVVKCKKVIQLDHHLSHAACSFYQSPFEESYVISYDGGGNDGVFNFYRASKKNGINRLNFSSQVNLGHAYMLTCYPIQDIKNDKGSLPRDLALAGKMMGLVAYGQVREEWLEPITNFYLSTGNWNLKSLGVEIGLPLGINTLSGKESYDFAATSQRVFEILFYSILKDFEHWLNREYNTEIDNLCLTGGAALNVLVNESMIRGSGKFNEHNFFVPPNPDDGGLSLGQLLLVNKETKCQDVTFNGLPILDKGEFNFYKKTRKSRKVSDIELADYIMNGKIVGIIQGDSEVGPRALGNRSIVCDPRFKNMKDILNSKVKFREWFRPFAPVCREKDANDYFLVGDGEFKNHRFMSFAPLVRDKFLNELPSICHEDKSSRLQIVHKDKDNIFYRILDSFQKIDSKKPCVILNTSFNILGKPILSTYKDAFYVLDNTELDAVYSNGILFEK